MTGCEGIGKCIKCGTWCIDTLLTKCNKCGELFCDECIDLHFDILCPDCGEAMEEIAPDDELGNYSYKCKCGCITDERRTVKNER